MISKHTINIKSLKFKHQALDKRKFVKLFTSIDLDELRWKDFCLTYELDFE